MSRIALVTGASSGIGLATATRLQDRGFTVYAGARRTDRMGELAERGIRVLELDVTSDASMRNAVEAILRDDGHIDVLVNNAGYGSYGAVEDVPIEEGRRQMEVNLFGLGRLCQLVLPSMRERRSGRLINVSSIGGRFGEPLGAWYHASKFAVEGFSDSLRLEVRDLGVHVVVIQPGAIRTEWGSIAVDTAAEHSEGTAYARHVQAMRTMYASAFERGVEPDVIGKVIAAAATVRRPKPRYAAPIQAKGLMLAVRLLPDRMLDYTVMRMRHGHVDTATPPAERAAHRVER